MFKKIYFSTAFLSLIGLGILMYSFMDMDNKMMSRRDSAREQCKSCHSETAIQSWSSESSSWKLASHHHSRDIAKPVASITESSLDDFGPEGSQSDRIAYNLMRVVVSIYCSYLLPTNCYP